MQRDRVLLKLRELVQNGAFEAGQRLAEIPVAERLGVSRTPVRQALHLLAGEGLLAPAGVRGYLVRPFSEKDVFDAIETRGIVEGAAARLLAEAGLDRAVERGLIECLEESREIVGRETYLLSDDAEWTEVNGRFHRLIVSATGNRALIGAYEANDRLPFASARATLGADTSDADLRRKHHEVVRRAQLEHEAVFASLLRRQGSRAEVLLRDHALLARENFILFRKLH
jgi:GntR family transcriptional regulator of vanillate catabolism